MAANREICTKCKKNPRKEPNGTNPWCAECRAEYMREYYATLPWRHERRGLLRGLAAMREYVANEFRRHTVRPFLGPEAAAFVMSLPGPPVASEDVIVSREDREKLVFSPEAIAADEDAKAQIP